MEQDLHLLAKKLWKNMRSMLKKGISKAKLIADLNMMMKSRKLAGKSLRNFLFHLQHKNWATATFHHRHPHHLPFPKSPSTDDDEFSCTTTPQHQNNALPPPPPPRSVNMALEMLKTTAAASSPVVKKVRVTDSPFPLSNGDEDGHEVDEDAEKFITRFYKGLRREN